MANVAAFKFPYSTDPIGPEEVFYFVLGPNDLFGSGAVTVTAQPTALGPNVSPGGEPLDMYMEVIQVGTRRTEGLGPHAPVFQYFLDVVVRNNTHPGEASATSIVAFDAYVSVVSP